MVVSWCRHQGMQNFSLVATWIQPSRLTGGAISLGPIWRLNLQVTGCGLQRKGQQIGRSCNSLGLFVGRGPFPAFSHLGFSIVGQVFFKACFDDILIAYTTTDLFLIHFEIVGYINLSTASFDVFCQCS